MSVSVFINRSDIPTDTSASPFSFAFAVPTGVSFNTTSTVDSGGALRTITVCAVAAPTHTVRFSAAAIASSRRVAIMLAS